MKNLIGTYKVTEYGYSYKKDKKFEPISDYFSGIIHYAEDGYMNVVIRFKEKPENFKDIVAYTGTYQVKGDEIIHQVISSVRPEYENETLIRKFKIVGNTLETEFENTDEFRKYAIWQKI